MNQKPKATNPNDFQLRLLIPQEWVEELNVLARAKYKSRLSLIREYLRAEIDRDFIDLKEFHNNRQNVRQARARTEAWCRELQERKRDDRW